MKDKLFFIEDDIRAREIEEEIKILELFSGTGSFTKVCKERGHNSFTIDNNKIHNPDLCIDILTFDLECFKYKPNIIWASPPCTSFSVASIGKHWFKDHTPKTEGAVLGLKLLEKTIKTIAELKPTYWILENPRGKMRKVIEPLFKKYGLDFKRETVSYCQYGDTRQKPTDLWTNCYNWKPRPICKPGASCHIAAPRGSRTGTQGLKSNLERSIIPRELCLEIIKACESGLNER